MKKTVDSKAKKAPKAVGKQPEPKLKAEAQYAAGHTKLSGSLLSEMTDPNCLPNVFDCDMEDMSMNGKMKDE